MPVTRDEVIAAYKVVLGRFPESENAIAHHSKFAEISELVAHLASSSENIAAQCALISNEIKDLVPPNVLRQIKSNKTNYIAPLDISQDPIYPRKVLLIGECFFNSWKEIANRMKFSSEISHLLINNLSRLPADICKSATDFDLQVIQIPIRTVLPERLYFKLDSSNVIGCRAIFEECKDKAVSILNDLMEYNTKYNIPTFVCNFIAPQRDLFGRFSPRYDLSNMLYIVEELNRILDSEVRKFKRAYLVDADAICGIYGKKFSRDDAICSTVHGGEPTDFDAQFDSKRLYVPPRIGLQYDIHAAPFISALWNEIFAMYRTLTGANVVKMVVIDLDDTLWRGLIGEGGAGDLEGWPMGFIESLIFLKKRGILLGILSRNDEAVVKANWRKVLKDTISLDDFAVARINYFSKSDNMKEILSAVNLLPRNVLFIDDNPVERGAMKAAFPDIRVLGELPGYLKRILLWSAETQFPYFTDETKRRTEMVQAQVRREEKRKVLSRQDFLLSLNIQVVVGVILASDDSTFDRAFELLNKTNQFNTTGQRWSRTEIEALFTSGGYLFCFSVEDTFTNYGLVGVVILKGHSIVQFVMSCRIAGLDIENGVLSAVLNRIRRTNTECLAHLRHTDVNLLCQDLYKNAGFQTQGEITDGVWYCKLGSDLRVPYICETPHITITDRSGV